MARKGLVERIKRIGPGTIVAAAIVGPGTVTTASSVGAEFGYILIWALVFSVLATMFLQEIDNSAGRRISNGSRRCVSKSISESDFENGYNPVDHFSDFRRECGIRSG